MRAMVRLTPRAVPYSAAPEAHGYLAVGIDAQNQAGGARMLAFT
jgi:hypothetical protein